MNSEVDSFLDESYNKKYSIPEVVTIPPFKKKSEIERAGKQVIEHLFLLAKDTDLTYQQMAKKINELYKTNLTSRKVNHFFKTNFEVLERLAAEEKNLSKIRASLTLEYNKIFVKDINLLDSEIKKVSEDEFIESDKRAIILGNLIDKKGKLLLRFARLSGDIQSPNLIQDNRQVNYFESSQSSDKSELIGRLKKAQFKTNVIGNAVNKTNN